LFGGRSAEHEVSLVSAASIIAALDKSKYEIVPIGIAPDGRWLSTPDAVSLLKSKADLSGKDEAIILPDPTRKGLFPLHRSSHESSEPLDVIFPVLHGTYGEDGTVQGLFEMAGIPYVGAGVLGSSVGMDKVVTKQLCERARIRVAPYVWFTRKAFERNPSEYLSAIRKKLRLPCFVKPANSGSSVGISKAHDSNELQAAIRLAGEYDRKILVEKSIERAREIELSVLGNDDPQASLPGEIVSSNEFYDYDAKYVDGKSIAIIPAKLSLMTIRRLQKIAIQTFAAVECAGMARVDFLVTRSTNTIYLNEINTIPGFTSISMYPKLWEASGLTYAQLLDRLIVLAIERFKDKQSLKTTFRPLKDWYRE
jgi:D-alanine-D-alanine ligase